MLESLQGYAQGRLHERIKGGQGDITLTLSYEELILLIAELEHSLSVVNRESHADMLAKIVFKQAFHVDLNIQGAYQRAQEEREGERQEKVREAEEAKQRAIDAYANRGRIRRFFDFLVMRTPPENTQS